MQSNYLDLDETYLSICSRISREVWPDQFNEEAFDPRRTVVFFPIYREFQRTWMERVARFFGDVKSIRYLMSDREGGFLIVVYKTLAGVYCAICYFTERKNPSPENFLRVRFLWPPKNFYHIGINRSSCPVSHLDPAVCENRVIRIPVFGDISESVVLEELIKFGPIEGIRLLGNSQKVTEVIEVRFKDPVDAIASVVCLFESDLCAALYVMDEEPDSPLVARPSWENLIRFPLELSYQEFDIENLLSGLQRHYTFDKGTFSCPKTVFGNELLEKIGKSIRIPVVNGAVSSIILRARKGTYPWKYFQLEMPLKTVPVEGFDTRFVGLGPTTKWVSYFYLRLNVFCCEIHDKCGIEGGFSLVNYLFPKLHPRIFDDLRSNFVFVAPAQLKFEPITEEHSRYARQSYAKFIQTHKGKPNPYGKPFISMISNAPCCTKTAYTVPVIVHSEDIKV